MLPLFHLKVSDFILYLSYLNQLALNSHAIHNQVPLKLKKLIFVAVKSNLLLVSLSPRMDMSL